MTSNNVDFEKVLRENLNLRRQVVAEFAKANEPVSLGQKVRQWSSAHFGRSEDQTLVLRSPDRDCPLLLPLASFTSLSVIARLCKSANV